MLRQGKVQDSTWSFGEYKEIEQAYWEFESLNSCLKIPFMSSEEAESIQCLPNTHLYVNRIQTREICLLPLVQCPDLSPAC